MEWKGAPSHIAHNLLQVGAVHFEYVTLRVTVSDKHLVILGLLWLESHCLWVPTISLYVWLALVFLKSVRYLRVNWNQAVNKDQRACLGFRHMAECRYSRFSWSVKMTNEWMASSSHSSRERNTMGWILVLSSKCWESMATHSCFGGIHLHYKNGFRCLRVGALVNAVLSWFRACSPAGFHARCFSFPWKREVKGCAKDLKPQMKMRWQLAKSMNHGFG